MTTRTMLKAYALPAFAIAALAGCSSSDSLTAGTGRALSLSFTTQNATAATADVGVSASAVPVTVNGHTLDLTTAALNISRVELHDTQRGELEEECEHHAGCGVISGSPLVVTLTPTTAMLTVTTALVPPGTYREIGIK